MGRRIKSIINNIQNAGFRSYIWDSTDDLGQNVPAGMYIYSIEAGEYMEARKIILLK